MNRTRTPKTKAVEPIAAFLNLGVLLGLAITFLMSSIAFAHAADEQEVAVLPVLAPTAPLTFKAACDGGVAVFSVQNNDRHWGERGSIRIVEVATGRVLRERSLTLGVRQTASFRVASKDMQGDRTRVMVRLPDDSMTYVKSFAGRCVAQR